MFELKSKITQKLLNYYFINPAKSHYINELASMLDIDPGNLYRKLKELESEGILASDRRGHQKYFFLNNKYSLLPELKKTFASKYGLAGLLKNKLLKISKIKEAYIFGSYAGNNFKAGSDIDLLLIGDHSSLSAKRLILPLAEKIKREINIIDLTPKEFENRKNTDDEFINHILSHKTIKLI
jgi:predicted nucleotidyltransferase